MNVLNDHSISVDFSDKELKACRSQKKAKSLLQGSSAACAASVAALVYNSTFSSVPHEGAHALAVLMTRTNQSKMPPVIKITSWDKLKQLWKTKSIQDLFNFLIFGRGGSTSYANTELNTLGKVMKENGTHAFVSIAGSVPNIALNSAAVAGGAALFENHPIMGASLLSFGITNHILNLEYPLSAAFMSNSELFQKASEGHDFANFAVEISPIAGVSPRAAAITTGILYAGIVPLAGMLGYMYMKNQELDFVSDHAAIQSWIKRMPADQEAKKLYFSIYDAYPRKKNYEKAFLESKDVEFRNELFLFREHLYKILPKTVIKSEKKRILKAWNQAQKPDFVQKAITCLSIIGTITQTAGTILKTLSETVAPSTATAATVFRSISPIFQGVSLVSTAYDTFKDITCKAESMPKVAKMVSVAKLIIAIVSTTLVVIGLFVPVLDIAVIIAVTVSGGVSIVLGFSRFMMIRSHIRFRIATEKSRMSDMVHRLIQLKQLHPNERIHREYLSKNYKDIFKWLRLVEYANWFGYLGPEQRDMLRRFKELLAN